MICVSIHFSAIFWKNPISEVSNIHQTSKLYSQIAEMLLYKIREYGDDRITFSKFFRRSQIIIKHRSPKMGSFERRLKLMKIGQNLKKIVFFKTSQLLTPTMINEKTQLGQVVSLLKGLGYYFYAEDEKSIFNIKIFIYGDSHGHLHSFYTGNGKEVQFLRSKIDFSSSA